MYAFSQRIKLLWRGFTRTSRGIYRECDMNVYKIYLNKNSKYSCKCLFIKMKTNICDELFLHVTLKLKYKYLYFIS